MKYRTLSLFGAITLFAALGITAQTSAQDTQPTSASQTDPKVQAKILDQYGKLPLSFEANYRQTDERVKFLSRTSGYTLFLTSDEAAFALRGNKAKDNPFGGSHRLLPSPVSTTNAVLRMKLRNANPAAKMTGFDELPGTSNYFIGNDPAKWRTNVPNYAKVKYEGIYPGIDLVYYGNQRQLEYDFIVAPGVDPRAIQFDFRGAKRIHKDEHGDLVLKMGEGEVRWQKLVVYQEKNGARQEIAANYDITDKNRVGFELAKYDTSRPLYIDPLIYSTYLGGSSYEQGAGIAVDTGGNAYVTGFTWSTDFPTMNPLQPTLGGVYAAFVAKLNPTGSALVYSTYLGGSGNDAGAGIAVDNAGNAYVTGTTGSTDFPTMNPLQPTYSGFGDAFVVKLNATGSALVYSTYLGGSNFDDGFGIAVDSASNAYLTGDTCSTDFPITPGAFQTTYGGGGCDIGDAFVAKLNSTGSALVYSTYLGGSDFDYGWAIAVDPSGSAYVTGTTDSTNFPTTVNSVQPRYGGRQDAFVAKLNPTGSALVYSTYLGGSGQETGNGIAVDSTGNAHVTGGTASTDFPTMNPLQSANAAIPGQPTAFVAELNPAGSTLVYSTYLGGSYFELGFAIAVDSAGNAYVTGGTASTDFPTMNPLQSANAAIPGQPTAFVAELNPAGSTLVYSTYLGGSNYDQGRGIAADSAGNAYITGYTLSTDFPVTPGAFQPKCGGGCAGGTYDAFVAKIASTQSDNIPPTTTAIPSPGPNTNGWNNTNVTVDLNATDNPGGSGVKQIQFALSGAENIGLQTVAGNAASVTISAEGITILTYFATDNAGNQETAKTLTVQIDETPPVISGLPAPGCSIWPPNHKLVQVATVTATDTLSGLAPGSFSVTGTSNDPANGQILITGGPSQFKVQLGADKGLTYTLTATASDLAGNTATLTATCTVPHDQGR